MWTGFIQQIGTAAKAFLDALAGSGVPVDLSGATINATISDVGQGDANGDATQAWSFRLSNGTSFYDIPIKTIGAAFGTLGLAVGGIDDSNNFQALPIIAPGDTSAKAVAITPANSSVVFSTLLTAGSSIIGYVRLADAGGSENDATHPVYVGPSTAAKAAAGATAARLTFDGSTFLALGQALAAACLPIVLPVAQDIIAKATAAVGAAVPANVVQSGGPDGSGNIRATRMSALGAAHSVPGPGTGGASTAYEASHVISSSACSPVSVRVFNKNASVRYLMLFNSATVPADGTIPDDMVQVAAANSQALTFAIPTTKYANGLTAVLSSSNTSLAIAAADAHFSWSLFPATS